MEQQLLPLLFCVTMVTVSAVYVHNGDTDAAEVDRVYTCPQDCICSEKRKTAQCQLSYTSYKHEILFPWQLTRLRIHGNLSLWNLQVARHSVKDVLNRDTDNIDRDTPTPEVDFTKLTHLDISYVPFQQVEESDFIDLPMLELLTLNNNNISRIEPKAFKHLSSLEVLNLSNNQIASLPDYIFGNLTNLKRLHLRSNRLTVLGDSVFFGLSRLELLDLRNNAISHLGTTVDAFNSLDRLDVRGNEIIYLPEEVVSKLVSFKRVLIAENPFWCSCNLRSLLDAFHSNSTVFDDFVECSAPDHLKHVKFKDLDLGTLPCDGANVSAVTLTSNVLYQGSLELECKVLGDLPLAVYWFTPWGETFTNRQSMLTFPEQYISAQTEKTFSAMNLLMTSKVHVSNDGSLHIDKYRGHFSGEFTCVGMNPIAQSNKTITIGIETKLPFLYITSLFIGTLSGGSMLVIAVVIGAVRMFVNKCLHSDACNSCCCSCDDVQIVDEKIKPEDFDIEVEVTAGSSESSLDDSEDDPSLPPPDPPVNSPQLRLSPEKCPTPDTDESGEQTKLPPAIWDQLEEVRSRLRYGAERKMEKVRSHVRSITDTGSLKIRNIKDAGSMKIQSIKETGSHAASKVKKNVASGMVQVKYGVQSIKEFCGTGDMGPGTVSMVSVSTDVDTKESVQMVRSHTFV